MKANKETILESYITWHECVIRDAITHAMAPYSDVAAFDEFTHDIADLAPSMDNFKVGLRDWLTEKTWKARGIDVKSRFLPKIERYFEWYGKHGHEYYKDKDPSLNLYKYLYDFLIETKEEILKYFPENKRPDNRPQFDKKKLETLFDIWLGTKEEYNDIINKLKNDTGPKAIPFVSETEEGLFWNKNPKKGFVQYMKWFLITCGEKGWIKKNTYSANQLMEIIFNTFNVKVNPGPFKDMVNEPPKFTNPFKNIPKKESNQNN